MVSVVRLLPKFCSCGNLLGSQQYRYEQLLLDGKSQVQALDEMGWKKMCCRKEVLLMVVYFIKSANIGALTDETGLFTRTGTISQGTIQTVVRDAPPPKWSREPPALPLLPGAQPPISARRQIVQSVSSTLPPITLVPPPPPSVTITPRIPPASR